MGGINLYPSSAVPAPDQNTGESAWQQIFFDNFSFRVLIEEESSMVSLIFRIRVNRGCV